MFCFVLKRTTWKKLWINNQQNFWNLSSSNFQAFKTLSNVAKLAWDGTKSLKSCLRIKVCIVSSNKPYCRKEYLLLNSSHFLQNNKLITYLAYSLYRKDINFIRKKSGKAMYWQSWGNRPNKSKIELGIYRQTSQEI